MANLNLSFTMTPKNMTVAKAALFLCLVDSRHEENELKKHLKSYFDYNSVVTEVGGTLGKIQREGDIGKAAVKAAINSGCIKSTSKDIHALVHAVAEAEKGIILASFSNASVALKVSIVNDRNWIAACIFGKSAIHKSTEHYRVGLGVMHYCVK